MSWGFDPGTMSRAFGLLSALHVVEQPDAMSLALVIALAGVTFAALAWRAGAIDLVYWRRASRA